MLEDVPCIHESLFPLHKEGQVDSKFHALLNDFSASIKKQLSMNRVSIPEETPSMVQLEHVNNNAKSKSTEVEVRRILPEVPKLPPEPGFEPDIVPKPKVSPKPTITQEKVKSPKGTKIIKCLNKQVSSNENGFQRLLLL